MIYHLGPSGFPVLNSFTPCYDDSPAAESAACDLFVEGSSAATGAATGTVWLDQGDERGRARLAGHSSAELGLSAPRARALTVPVPVARPWHASLVLHPAAGARPGKYWPELAGLSAGDRKSVV